MPKLARLNAMQARRQASRARRAVLGAAWCAPIANSQVIDEDEATRIVNRIRAAYEAMKGGTDDPKRFDTVAWAMNVAAVRAADIDERLLAMLVDTTDALNSTRARFERTGRFGFTGPQILTMNAAMDAYEAIVRASSPLQMNEADDAVERMMERSWWKKDGHGATPSSGAHQGDPHDQ